MATDSKGVGVSSVPELSTTEFDGQGPFLDITKMTASEFSTSADAVPFWGDNPGAWDTVFLDGLQLPGICKMTGVGLKRGVDKKKVKGKNGCTITFHGNDAAEVKFSLTINTEEELQDLQRAIYYLKNKTKTSVVGETSQQRNARLANVVPEDDIGSVGRGNQNFASVSKQLAEGGNDATKQPPGKKVTTLQPVSIIHPACAIHGIASVFVLDVTMPEVIGEGSGAVKCEFTCLEATSEILRNQAGVNTPNTTGNYDITKLGPGAVGRAVATPSRNNTGP